MRYLRLVLGSAIILVAVWIIVSEQMAGASADASINAQVATVRAPLAGRLDLETLRLGQQVQRGDRVATLTDERPDISRLNDLKLQARLAAIDSAQAEATAEIAATAAGDATRPQNAQRLADDVSAAQAREAALTRRVEEEEVAENRQKGATLTSPVNGLVWERLATNGEAVQRGDPVLRLIDCDSAFVTMSVTESVYNRLQIGDEATFRAAGDRQTLPATVVRKAGAGAAMLYRTLAIQPTPKHLERFDVALQVPGLRADPVLACDVGHTGRAYFDARPMDWLRDLFR